MTQLKRTESTTSRQVGDGVQYPLIILGAAQFEHGRDVLGWVLIGAGILFKIVLNYDFWKMVRGK